MDFSSLTGFDIAVLVIIGLSTIFAFTKGFTTVALSFAAWIGALLVTIYGYSYVVDYPRVYIKPEELSDLITVVGLFFLSLFILKTIATWIGSTIKESALGFLDRSAGALFGLLRGIVVVSVAYLAFTRLFPGTDQPQWMSNAQLRPLVAWGAEMLEGFSDEAMNKDSKKTGKNYIDKAKDAIPSTFVDDAKEKLAPVYEKAQQKALEELANEASKQLEAEAKKKLEDAKKKDGGN